MKKLLILAMVAVFAFAGFAVAEKGHEGHDHAMMAGHDKEMMNHNCTVDCMELFHQDKADYMIENTKMGVKIIIMSKDKKTVKKIQESAEKWLEHRNSMGDMDDMHGMKHDMKTMSAKSAKGSEKSEMVTCPVMGTVFPKDQAYSSTVYKGKTYYFCCAMCPDKFKANPEKYVK